MGSSNTPPAAPDYGKTFQEGIDVYLKNLPRLLDTETQTRDTIDPLRIAQQQALQQQFGPTQVQQQLDALHQFDPDSQAVRGSLSKSIQSDLSAGYNLPPEYARQLEQNARGAQTARGNAYGSGPAIAETMLKGRAALDLYQQHLQNAGNFLSSPTPEQQALAIQGVQPDRSMAYASPAAGTAGANFGLSNYQNLLAQSQLSGGGNPWGSAGSGAIQGAALGTQISPGWGTLIGGAAGAALGYFGNSSDSRLKENIRHICKSAAGFPMVIFNYKGRKETYVGTLAEDVKKVLPEAVGERDGYLTVDYDQIDIPFYELKGLA
jgi:Chaperone of endosialidase